ncbi:MAG: insulinase family protein [Candidatus Eisenbacteria bacterium]|nr:insulinase family protein [Candidatus Eisenbacteria bacterium]
MTHERFGAITLTVLVTLMLATAAPAADVGVHRLPNGVTVLTMPAKWNRIVAVSVMVDAGAKHDPSKLSGLAHLTAAMLPQGTTTRSATELAELVDSSGIQLGTETTHDYAHIYVTTIASRLDTGLEVLADVLQHPAFDQKHLLEAQRMAHDSLDAAADDPFNTPFTRTSELLFDGHPYSRPVEGTEDGIDRITVKHLVKFHGSRYVGGNTVIAIVGDFSPEHAVERLTELLSDYPDGGEPDMAPPPPPLPPPPAESTTVKIFADVDQAYLAMGFLAPSIHDDDYAAVTVINGLMGVGSGSRLSRLLGPDGTDIADKMGSYCRCIDDASAFTLYASTESPDVTVEMMREELARLASEPVPDDELKEAKNRVIGRYVITGQTNLARAARMAFPELAGLGYSREESYLSEVNRVDKDDIMRVASVWLRKPFTVIVYPGKTSLRERAAVRGGI